jgi:hypothetical protein
MGGREPEDNLRVEGRGAWEDSPEARKRPLPSPSFAILELRPILGRLDTSKRYLYLKEVG